MPELADLPYERITDSITVARRAQRECQAINETGAVSVLSNRIDVLLDELARRLP